MMLRAALLGVLMATASQACALAGPVGEAHRMTTTPTAALRDAEHRPDLRITVWYPAAEGAAETPLIIGPPDAPLFDIGSSAADAPFAEPAKRKPVVLLSHGFGGSARMMGWFGTALARQGYVVIAVDHPGNNAVDKMTPAGASLWWNRPGDLAAALAKVKGDPLLGSQLDLRRVGAAGFSAGGFTALAATGARVDVDHMNAFCADHPEDGVCKPQIEFPVSAEQRKALLADPAVQTNRVTASGAHAIPEVRAAFAMAPALVQAFDPASLASLRKPVHVVLGDIDQVAPPQTNGMVLGEVVPGAEVTVLTNVAHYDFLSTCSAQGKVALPQLCAAKTPQDATHARTIEEALAFFGKTLAAPGS